MVLDCQDQAPDTGLIQFLLQLNRSSFPGFLKSVFVIKASLEAMEKDASKVLFFRTGEVKKMVHLLPPDFQRPLFRFVQLNTVSESYGGYLPQQQIFDIRGLIVDSLVKQGIL